MSEKGIQNPENIKYYSTIDGKKDLTWSQVFSDFIQYLKRDGEELEKFKNDEKLLQVATRMFLIRKRHLGPGQQPNKGVAKELYEKIINEFHALETALPKEKEPIEEKGVPIEENWRIQSARRQQWHEENRAGQPYEESGLE